MRVVETTTFMKKIKLCIKNGDGSCYQSKEDKVDGSDHDSSFENSQSMSTDGEIDEDYLTMVD